MYFHQIDALFRRVLSYAKSDWSFGDYPIRTWKNPNASEANVAYGAGLVNWSGLVGHGETIENAILALEKNFDTFRSGGGKLPRPGSHVPLQFANSENLNCYEDIARDFFPRILGLNFDDGFFSDITELGDFVSLDPPEEDFKQRTIDLIQATYAVDVTDLYDKPLWMVLERIKSSPAQ
jgi:hypothetical protein